MARGLKIDAAIEAVPSPQWVKDRSSLGEASNAQRLPTDSHSTIIDATHRSPAGEARTMPTIAVNTINKLTLGFVSARYSRHAGRGSAVISESSGAIAMGGE
jgi:hypothetical protein